MKKIDHQSKENKNIHYYHKTIRAQFHRITALTKKEIAVLVNDKIAIILLIVLPISVILLTNFAGSSNDSDLSSSESGNPISNLGIKFSTPTIGIIDFDESEGWANGDLSQEFISIFEDLEEENECFLEFNQNRSKLEEMLGEGLINAYLVLENGFEYNISTHFVGLFNVYLDSYDNFVMQDVLRVLDTALMNFKLKFNFTGAITTDTKLVNVPESGRSLRSFSPYFYALLVMALPILIESQTLIADMPKDRMILTPTNKREILISKYLGGVIVCSSLAVAVTITSLILGLNPTSGGFLFFLIMLLIIVIGISLGILISSISGTSLQGFQYSLLVIIIQEMLMLFVNNVDFLSIFPLYTMQEIYRLTILKGVPLFSLKNTIGIPFILITAIEFVITMVFSYIFYLKNRSVV